MKLWLLLLCPLAAAAVEVTTAGVLGDGADHTAALQQLLDRNPGMVSFPPGTYRLGALKLPGDTRLEFAPGAVWQVAPEGSDEAVAADIAGDRVTISGATFDLSLLPPAKAKQVRTLIRADGHADLRLTGLTIHRPQEGKLPVGSHAGWQSDVVVLNASNFEHVEVDHCDVSNLRTLVATTFCRDVAVHDNRGMWCEHLSRFANGSRDVRHYANWSRYVVHQCMWWGGDANATHGWVPDGSSNVVHEDLRPGDEGYNDHTAGVYNVSVQNNYAEYGVTLCWGAKARDVVMQGNTARYMEDMAYDSEGDEHVVIANNLSINAKAAGIGCYFWTDKVLITGNQLITNRQEAESYHGNFIRLHSGGKGTTDEYGTGHCLVSGNLMVCELDEPRALVIEACRDVTIDGNKFQNGRIHTNDWDAGRRICLTNNEFTTNLATAYTPLKLVHKGAELQVINNRLRWDRPAEVTGEEAPAMLIRNKDQAEQFIVGNLIRGWATSLATLTPKSGEAIPLVVLRDNLVDGAFGLDPEVRPTSLIEEGNVDLRKE